MEEDNFTSMSNKKENNKSNIQEVVGPLIIAFLALLMILLGYSFILL